MSARRDGARKKGSERDCATACGMIESKTGRSEIRTGANASAERPDFPRDQLVLGMQVHRAPRVLQAGGCFGTVIPATGISALAGCALSTSLSRAYLQDVVCARPRSTGHWLGQHVDDVCQIIIGDSERQVAACAAREGSLLAEGLRGLKISPKSTVVAHTKRLANVIAARLHRDGQPLTECTTAGPPGSATATTVVVQTQGNMTSCVGTQQCIHNTTTHAYTQMYVETYVYI